MLKVTSRNIVRGDIRINPKIHSKVIYISPCNVEHWISTDLFKFKIYAERQGLHVIGACSKNYIPHYSLFCDEIIVLPNREKLEWYDGHSIVGFWFNKPYVDIQEGEMRKTFCEEISDAEVIKRFKTRKVHVLREAYDKFFTLDLPKDLLICEIKPGRHNYRSKMKELELPMIVGEDYQFQKDLIAKVGQDNYMTTQILASKHLNWQYFCLGGSSNLLSVIPVKSIFLRDQTISQSVKAVVRGLSPHPKWPVCLNYTDQEMTFKPLPDGGSLDKDFVLAAFGDMSAVNIDFEIIPI